MKRAAALVVIGGLLVAAAVMDAPRSSGDTPPTGTSENPALTSGEALSSAWYCAEGTAVADGRADETVVIANLGDEPTEAEVTVMGGADVPPAVRSVEVPARGQARVPVSEIAAVPDPGVVVEVFGGPAAVDHVVTGLDDLAVGPCATEASDSWWFAAGTTARGVEQWLAVLNPFGDDAIVDVTFFTDQGISAPEALQGLVVPRRSRLAVPAHDHVRRQAVVATEVVARTGRVVAEQSLLFDDTDDGRHGLAMSLGVTAPRLSWVFPAPVLDGASLVAIVNAAEQPTEVEVATLLEGEASLEPQTVAIPARSVAVVDVTGRVPAGIGYWVDVRATGSVPVVVELLGARPDGDGVATTPGSATANARWALALGTLGADTAEWLAVTNPGDTEVSYELRALAGGDAGVALADQVIGPRERAVVGLAPLELPDDAVLVVEATGPVVVARDAQPGAGLTRSPAVPAGG